MKAENVIVVAQTLVDEVLDLRNGFAAAALAMNDENAGDFLTNGFPKKHG